MGNRAFVHYRIVSAVKRVEAVSNRMSYIALRGCLCNIIVLNAQAPTKEKSDSSKQFFFFKELQQVLEHFPQHYMEILVRDFNAKLGIKDIFKLN